MAEVPMPTIGDRDVLIRIRQAAICGTDVHIWKWDEWAAQTVPVGLTVGHEYVGVVEACGREVTHLKVGQRVSGEGHIVCGHCRNCRAGRRHLCAHTLGVGIHRPGAFAEFLSLPMENVVPVPDDIPDEVAAIFDPLGNAVHTALSFDLVGEDVLITGAGPIGIMAIAIAKAAGVDASKVAFLSVSPALREPMLVRREADGVTGFVTTSALALKGIGLDHPAQRVMMYYDHGLNLYGGAILTTRAFIERNPAVVRGATAALMRGFRDTLRNGQEMLDNLKRVEPLTDVALERERHEMNVARVIMSDHVRANGLSSVDMGRLQTGIRAVEEAYNLQPKVQAAQIYTPDFLPPAADRAV